MVELYLVAQVERTAGLSETECDTLITARRGQGVFMQRVIAIEKRCLITLVENPVHLLASHCRPGRDSDDEGRLHGERIAAL